MTIDFKKISDFNRGILKDLLTDAYAHDERYQLLWGADWKIFDDFFFDNLDIANKAGFITMVDSMPIGLVSWDPRQRPDYVQIGHNCLRSTCKGKGYGKLQLKEAIDRIKEEEVKKIIVTTNVELFPAQQMYQSVGFIKYQMRKNEGEAEFIGDYIDLVMEC